MGIEFNAQVGVKTDLDIITDKEEPRVMFLENLKVNVDKSKGYDYIIQRIKQRAESAVKTEDEDLTFVSVENITILL